MLISKEIENYKFKSKLNKCKNRKISIKYKDNNEDPNLGSYFNMNDDSLDFESSCNSYINEDNFTK